ncbi:MAG: hypothetical protein ACREQ4_15350 [Candidatus Binataceae bacterium]
MPTLERQWLLYKETLARHGHPLPAMRPAVQELHLAPTREEAIAAARPLLEAKYAAAYAQWGQDKVLPGNESFRVDFDQLARDRFILGNPDDVIDQLERRVERLECSFFCFRVGWPAMENYQQLKVIELMGAQVLPYFYRKYGRS